MVVLTDKEWAKCRELWGRSKPVGTMVLVRAITVDFKKPTKKKESFSKWMLSDGGIWVRQD